jgi:hypothetical protein
MYWEAILTIFTILLTYLVISLFITLLKMSTLERTLSESKAVTNGNISSAVDKARGFNTLKSYTLLVDFLGSGLKATDVRTDVAGLDLYVNTNSDVQQLSKVASKFKAIEFLHLSGWNTGNSAILKDYSNGRLRHIMIGGVTFIVLPLVASSSDRSITRSIPVVAELARNVIWNNNVEHRFPISALNNNLNTSLATAIPITTSDNILVNAVAW